MKHVPSLRLQQKARVCFCSGASAINKKTPSRGANSPYDDGVSLGPDYLAQEF